MRTKGLFVVVAIAVVTIYSTAQENKNRFGFELSTGASVATQKIGNTKVNPGFGFEGIFQYSFIPQAAIYKGWGWNRFGAENSFAGSDVCFEETGYVFGLQYQYNLGSSPISWYVRAGGLFNHIEVENSDGEIIGDTGHELGYQLATGISAPIGKNWSFTPGLKFNHVSGDVEIEDFTTQIDHSYLSLRVGFLKKF